MANEQEIIAACMLDRASYERIAAEGMLSEFTAMGTHWLHSIGEYYGRDPDADRCSVTTLRELGLQKVGVNVRDTVAAYLDEIPIVGTSPVNVTAAILGFRRRQVGLRLAALLADAGSDDGEVRELVEQYSTLMDTISSGLHRPNYITTADLDTVYDTGSVVPLFPTSIFGRKLAGGGAIPGHHILIYGRPEAGKSLFAIHQACGIAHSGRRVLYAGNEESVKTHMMRAASNMANVNIEHLRDKTKRDKILEVAEQRGLDNITFLEMEGGTFGELEVAMRDIKPAAVFIDQLSGIDVSESNPVTSVDKAARAARSLIKRCGAVGFSVGQAGDRTEKSGQLPPAWLSMGDVYGSRTGLPAQVDLMLGIGYDEEMFYRNVRAISLPKNKLGGDHEGFKVRIEKQTSKIRALS